MTPICSGLGVLHAASGMQLSVTHAPYNLNLAEFTVCSNKLKSGHVWDSGHYTRLVATSISMFVPVVLLLLLLPTPTAPPSKHKQGNTSFFEDMSSWSGSWRGDWGRDWNSGGDDGGGWKRGGRNPEPGRTGHEPKKKAKAKPKGKSLPKAKAGPEPEANSRANREADRLPMREEIAALRQKEATDKATTTELRQEMAQQLEVHGADAARISMLTEAGTLAVKKSNEMEARAWQSGC